MTREEALDELKRLNTEHKYPRITVHGEWEDCAEIIEADGVYSVAVDELPHLRAHREHLEELERLRLEAEELARQEGEETGHGD